MYEVFHWLESIANIWKEDWEQKCAMALADIMKKRRKYLLWWMLIFTLFSNHQPSGPMLSISRFVRLYVHLSIRVFTFEVAFKRLFAPTSQSWMSNIFRDLESLGKSNGKKWSQIWSCLFGGGLKLPNKKKVFWLSLPYKLDGVGPVDNRPSTAKLYHFVRKNK